MYEAYYGLRERPFDLTPNPRFLCMTPGHQEALVTIQYGIASRKGFTLLVGPAGSGKTTLVQAALEQQDPNTRSACLTNPLMTRDELFEFLADAFAVPHEALRSKPAFLAAFRSTLLALRAKQTATALIIDEAQAMPDDLLEEVRLLEHLETTTEKLLPVVLVAHTEFADRLNQPALLPIKQRVALRSSLPALTAEETATYVAERIRIAGGEVHRVFTPQAVAAIFDASGGIPRTISVLCDNALVSGFAIDQRPVGTALIAEVCRDFDLPIPRVGLSATSAPDTAAGEAHGVALPPAERDGSLVVRQATPMPQFLEQEPDMTMSHLEMSASVALGTLAVEPPASGEQTTRTSLPERMRGLRARFTRSDPS